MNKFFALVFSIVLLNCSGKDPNSNITSKQIAVQKSGYEKVSNKSSTISNEILSLVQFANIQLPLNLVFFKESERTFLNLNDLYVQVNWLYKIKNDQISANNIILFKNNLDYVILVPTFTEEFPTFEVVRIDKSKKIVYDGQHTYSPADFEKLESTSFDKVDYQIRRINNELRIYAIANHKEILFSDYSKIKNVETPITATERNEIKDLQKQTTDDTDITTTHKIFLDLDLDGNKKDFKINFINGTINGAKNSGRDIFFEKKSLIIQKEFQDNNPHDFINYRYYFSEFNDSVILKKVEFERETYVENNEICKLNYTYLPHDKIYFSQVDFFNKTFLHSLIRNVSLKAAIEITTKINRNYNCTSHLTKMELNYLLNKTILDNNTVQNYNNLAYYLEQNRQYQESIFLLNKILEIYPNRIVAWLNYGDSLWEINEKSQAKSAYQKYILLMQSQGKDLSKIPDRVHDRR